MTCEICGREECRAASFSGHFNENRVGCLSRGYEREKARADREHAARWELEKERGEVNAALKNEMARADRAEVALRVSAAAYESLETALADELRKEMGK